MIKNKGYLKAKESLINIFKEAEKNKYNYMLGIEIEHFILKKNTLEAVSYFEDQGVEDILIELSNRYNYKKKYEKDHVIGLENNKLAVSLEPGGQIEVALKPQATLQEIEKVYLSFLKEIVPILKEKNRLIINVGYQPVSSIKEIPIIPKKRYEFMYNYFKEQGKYAHNMMKGTASIQVNIDYSNEDDYIKKNRVINFLSPLIYAAFDNSPFFEGEICKNQSMRANIWDNCDNKRCGLSPNPFAEDFGYKNYADYILNNPPIFVNKNDKLIYTGDNLFNDIFDHNQFTKKELKHLLTMSFPDVRTKQYIEIRMGDSLPIDYMMGFVAFWKGILYNEDNLNLLYNEIGNYNNEEILKIKNKIKNKGKKISFNGRPLMEYYKYLLSLAQKALTDCEQDYLKKLFELAENGLVPKDITLRLNEKKKNNALEWCIGNNIV